jgi:hypothetical protein
MGDLIRRAAEDDSSRGFAEIFQGAMAMLVSAPEFNGSPSVMSLNERFDAYLREPLSVVARKKRAEKYMGLLSDQTELAYRQYSEGDPETARKTMVHLLDLIHEHLHLPSRKQIQEWVAEAKSSD